MSKKGDGYDNAAMESWKQSFKVEAVHGERFKPVPKPSIKCSNILKCITIANGFIQNWAILARKLLKQKKSLSGVSVKSGQDHILRCAMRGLVPDSILNRRDKIGFGTPEDGWFRHPALREVIHEALESDILRNNGMIDISEMRRIFTQHMSGAGDHSRALWKCLHLYLWLSDLRGDVEDTTVRAPHGYSAPPTVAA